MVPAEPAYCRVKAGTELKVFEPKTQPKYFFKPVGSGHEIGFVGFEKKTFQDQNTILNLDTGSTVIIPGEFDPIGLYGTDLITIPLQDGKGSLVMNFYDLRELRTQGLKTKPILTPDRSLTGRYQSMGVISKSGSKIKFRLITDGQGSGEFKDFEADFSTLPLSLKPLSETHPICRNLYHKGKALSLKLPMISKDAHFFSAFDTDQQLMRLFRIDSDGKCTETKGPAIDRGDIGKLDFSPDSKQVAFHFSDRSLDYNPIEFGSPLPSWQLRSAIYDLEHDTYQILPFSGLGASTYYPAFLPNGNVLVLEIQDDHFQFVEIRPDASHAIPRAEIERLYRIKNEDFAPFQWLSNQWMEQCSKSVTRSMRYNRLLLIFSWTKEQCKKVISNAVSPPISGDAKKVAEVCESLKD